MHGGASYCTGKEATLRSIHSAGAIRLSRVRLRQPKFESDDAPKCASFSLEQPPLRSARASASLGKGTVFIAASLFNSAASGATLLAKRCGKPIVMCTHLNQLWILPWIYSSQGCVACERTTVAFPLPTSFRIRLPNRNDGAGDHVPTPAPEGQRSSNRRAHSHPATTVRPSASRHCGVDDGGRHRPREKGEWVLWIQGLHGRKGRVKYRS